MPGLKHQDHFGLFKAVAVNGKATRIDRSDAKTSKASSWLSTRSCLWQVRICVEILSAWATHESWRNLSQKKTKYSKIPGPGTFILCNASNTNNYKTCSGVIWPNMAKRMSDSEGKPYISWQQKPSGFRWNSMNHPQPPDAHWKQPAVLAHLKIALHIKRSQNPSFQVKFCKCSNDGVMLSTPEARFFSTFEAKKIALWGLWPQFHSGEAFWFSPPSWHRLPWCLSVDPRVRQQPAISIRFFVGAWGTSMPDEESEDLSFQSDPIWWLKSRVDR